MHKLTRYDAATRSQPQTGKWLVNRPQMEKTTRLPPWYLLGGTNLGLLPPERPDVAAYQTVLEELELHQLVPDPTRPGARPSLIDQC
ncbi:hypothetical protein FJT64_007133 [Amphibalanus amphitrite]|uniref:Uncharacterized protein n=1 Tax=Amphibalanus amphitrite TaxID=1232801 RepID=A0A6A4VUP3_AMPAM|nr:hypothetical protein FJT64_007133 [Amphibalanus amphitrite]